MPAKTSAVLLMLLAALLQARPQRPDPDITFIESPVLKIGLDRSMGASITWLSWDKHPQNVINIHDPGRLIQQSYYAGKSLDRRADGQSKAWSPWTWNPIQGGGVNSWARVTMLKHTDAYTVVAETVPKLWDMPDEEAEALMQQQVRFEQGMPNVVVVRNRLLCRRKDGDRWGPAVARHQELPACYFTSRFRSVASYLGRGEWREVPQVAGPPWRKEHPELKVMACFEDGGQGVAVFSPTSDQHWNFGSHGRYDADAGPTDAPCMHLAPIGMVELGPTSTLDYRYWIIVGDKLSITAAADKLLAKYRAEKMLLKNE